MTSESQECVILLHGLGRTRRSMSKLSKALQHAGYDTYNCDYPSRKKSIDQLSNTIIAEAIQYCLTHFACKRIHCVTHSMGGILLRYYLDRHKIQNLGRVVMLAPPNRGSELVDHLSKYQLFELLGGPAALQLGTQSSHIPKSLGSVYYEVGIIAGGKSLNILSSVLIPGDSDGTVSIESTRLEGMTDFIVLPYNHTFLMSKSGVIKQTIHFLQHGKFMH